ncbi:MAG: phosphotransferase [Acidimicrobiia bacterium]|nr:phosphotransferase [Acidimicrobiia bacterium]
MSRPSDNRPTDAAVVEFLRSHHGAEPEELERLDGGFWSAAYGYRLGDEELVLRINDEPDGFRDDRRAMRYGSPNLPVPEVLAIGEGFGRWFAVSRRHRGRFLEIVGGDEVETAGATVVGLLAALRSVPPDDTVAPPWRTWLLDGITDRPDHHTRGWRSKIATARNVDRTFRAAERRIGSLIDACEDRNQLVHSDLLHQNVLVSPAADAVTAVFSWKCSTWGDSLYDLAWCTFWGRWHPNIGALDLWERVVPGLAPADALDVAVRHHVYELQIGAGHLGWYATIGDDDGLSWTARQLDELLEQGPWEAPDDPQGRFNSR